MREDFIDNAIKQRRKQVRNSRFDHVKVHLPHLDLEYGCKRHDIPLFLGPVPLKDLEEFRKEIMQRVLITPKREIVSGLCHDENGNLDAAIDSLRFKVRDDYACYYPNLCITSQPNSDFLREFVPCAAELIAIDQTRHYDPVIALPHINKLINDYLKTYGTSLTKIMDSAGELVTETRPKDYATRDLEYTTRVFLGSLASMAKNSDIKPAEYFSRLKQEKVYPLSTIDQTLLDHIEMKLHT